MKAWGKVRTELEKRIARELVERFPDKFNSYEYVVANIIQTMRHYIPKGLEEGFS